LIPPPAPTSGLALARITAASYFLGDWQDVQATTLEQQLFVGAACVPVKVPPSLQPQSSPSYAAPNPDPRFALWTAFDLGGVDPAPALVPSPASLGTGSSTASGAAGPYLDAWGAVLGNARWSYFNIAATPPAWVIETDAAYAVRLITTIARPSTTNYGMAAILDCVFGLNTDVNGVNQGHVVVTNGGSYQRFNMAGASSPRVGDSTFTPSADARAVGFFAGSDEVAGTFAVRIPLTRNADQTIGPNHISQGFLLTMINRLKLGGTMCASIFASNDVGYSS
jgi:hypothetical protein